MQTPSIAEMHSKALVRFKANPDKCYQRHLRELWDEAENRPHLESLKGARVARISRKEAESVILKYEWLAGNPNNKSPMGYGIKAYYGLLLDGELLGAACLGVAGGQVGNICGSAEINKTISIVRGACVPHAPKNAGSFFVTYVCKQAYHDFGWQIFFAYSDADAGEIGTIYQAAGWTFLGVRANSGNHYDYLSPDGSRLIKSHALNHDPKRKILLSLKWPPCPIHGLKPKRCSQCIPMRRWLRGLGWKEIANKPKTVWVWFEGSPGEKQRFREIAKTQRGYTALPYPKREVK